MLHRGAFGARSSQEVVNSSPDTLDETLDQDFSALCLEVITQEELLDRFAAELSYLNCLTSTCAGSKLIDVYKPVSKRFLTG